MKLRLIYYKDIVDMTLKVFISDNEGLFARSGDNYVLGKSNAQSKLKAELENGIAAAISNLFGNGSEFSNDKLIIIGSCFPLENMVMQFKDELYFPKKLDDAICEKPYVRWILRERDIIVDAAAINWQLTKTFNEMLAGHGKVLSLLKKHGNTVKDNVICVAHRKLDSYTVFKVIKWIYGSSNCINVHAEKLNDYWPCLIDVNELVSKYIHRKNEMNRSQEFKKCALEVKEYLAKKIGI